MVVSLATRLETLLREPSEPEPSGTAARIDGRLPFDGPSLADLVQTLNLVSRAATLELSGFSGGPEVSEWGSPGDELVWDLGEIARIHLDLQPAFPKDAEGNYRGAFIDFVEAVQIEWGDAAPLRGSAIRSAYNRRKKLRDQTEGK